MYFIWQLLNIASIIFDLHYIWHLIYLTFTTYVFDLHHFDSYRTKYFVYVCLQHIANPKSDEWTRFMHTLQDLKNQLADAEDEASSLSGLSSSPLR